jgi:hypothetical protein
MADPLIWKYLWRCALAFGLGLVSLMLSFVGEGLGEILSIVTGIACLSIFLFLCQFLLSLRETNYLFSNRMVGSNVPIIVALDLPLLILFLMMFGEKRKGVILMQGVPLLLFGCTSTVAGAVTALFVGRRKVEKHH